MAANGLDYLTDPKQKTGTLAVWWILPMEPCQAACVATN